MKIGNPVPAFYLICKLEESETKIWTRLTDTMVNSVCANIERSKDKDKDKGIC